jgi:antitoxin (DNA-binding transcriptional repressor) of toxin-antitoxin stability system
MTPGATRSIGALRVALIGPLPSIGLPSASTTRPSSFGPTGTSRMRPGGLDRVALGDVLVVAEHDRADRVLLEVQRQAEAAARELDHLAVLDVGQAVDAHDAVGDGDDRADVALSVAAANFSMRA